MSEPIKWAEATDKDKVRLIIEQVFHFSLLPDSVYVDVYTPEAVNGQTLAFWDSSDGRWQLRDDRQETISFDPLHHMEDAFQIVEELYEKHSMDMHLVMEKDYLRRYHVYGFSNCKGGLGGDGHGSDASMNEAICVASLRIMGIEVQV